MLKAKEAREKTKYECKNLSADILINDIDKYIKDACDKKQIEMNYIVDGTQYNLKTVYKAIKILKHNGYKVKITNVYVVRVNNPTHVELNIRWWW